MVVDHVAMMLDKNQPKFARTNARGIIEDIVRYCRDALLTDDKRRG